MTRTSTSRVAHTSLLFAFLAILLWSGIAPRDRFTWVLEVTPAIVGVGVLAATYARFRFTTLAYALAWVFAVILLVGGHYTYERVPLGDWLRDTLSLGRNHYDRMGHFMQGVVPAILTRELLIRTAAVRRGWMFFVVTCVCLAISAAYELIEWTVAVSTGDAADAFLGMQGDPWDTQTDMALALAGAVVAQLVLGRMHDRAIGRVTA